MVRCWREQLEVSVNFAIKNNHLTLGQSFLLLVYLIFVFRIKCNEKNFIYLVQIRRAYEIILDEAIKTKKPINWDSDIGKFLM